MRTSIDSARAKRADVEKLRRRVSSAESEAPAVSSEELAAAYDAAEERTVARWGMRVCDITSRDAAAFFQLALDQRPPFGPEKDTGYKDAVILFSVIDDLIARPESALLVAEDRDFKGVNLSNLLTTTGAELTVDSAAGVQRTLATYLSVTQSFERVRDGETARRAVEAVRDNLEEFLQAALRFVGPDFQAATLLAVNRVWLIRVDSVITPWPAEHNEGDQVRLTVLATVGVLITARRWPVPPAESPLGAGESKGLPGQVLADPWSYFQAGTESHEKPVNIEAQATYQNGEYIDVQFISGVVTERLSDLLVRSLSQPVGTTSPEL